MQTLQVLYVLYVVRIKFQGINHYRLALIGTVILFCFVFITSSTFRICSKCYTNAKELIVIVSH